MKPLLNASAQLRVLVGDTSPDSAAALVARLLVSMGPATSADISTRTGLSRASVSQVLSEFRNAGIVTETNAEASDKLKRGRGRPQMLQCIAPGIGHAVGVLLGLHELRVLLSDAAHNIVADVSIPIEVDYSPERAIEVLAAELATICLSHGTSLSDLLGIGIAVAAPISPQGRISMGSIIPLWDGVDLAAQIGDIFPCPVFADNESNCAAQSKLLWGAARTLQDFVYVTFDYGIGGAVVFDRKVRRGADGTAAELGHLKIEDPGKLCRCGRHGCLETHAAVDVVLDELSVAKDRKIELAGMRRLLSARDPDAEAIVADAAAYCGKALAIVSSVLSPGHFVLDGIMTSLGPPFLDPMLAAFAKESRSCHPDFIFAAETLDDKMRGAVGLVFCQEGLLPTKCRGMLPA